MQGLCGVLFRARCARVPREVRRSCRKFHQSCANPRVVPQRATRVEAVLWDWRRIGGTRAQDEWNRAHLAWNPTAVSPDAWPLPCAPSLRAGPSLR